MYGGLLRIIYMTFFSNPIKHLNRYLGLIVFHRKLVSACVCVVEMIYFLQTTFNLFLLEITFSKELRAQYEEERAENTDPLSFKLAVPILSALSSTTTAAMK